MNRPIDAPSSGGEPDATRRQLLRVAAGGAALATLPPAGAQSVIEPPASSRELWQWVRLQPAIEPRIAYFDSATLGPTWRAAMANEYRARESSSVHVARFGDQDRWIEESARLAKRFGAFFGCDADEVLFTRGAGESLSIVAAGLDLAAGDEIVTTEHEHPAAIAPWQILARRRGVIIKPIRLAGPLPGPEEALGRVAGAVTERTRVLLCSHVQYTDGALMPIADLCRFARERGILTVIDGAQATGMLQVDVRELGCDFYAASFHKWLCGSHGTGLLYVRGEALERLWPIEPRLDGWQPGLPAALQKLGNRVPYAWPALRGTETALDLHARINRARIEARVRELAIYARLRLEQFSTLELVTPAAPGQWAGILTARVPGREIADVLEVLRRVHRVRIGSAPLPGSDERALRISLNIFNSHDDIEQLINALRVVIGT